MAPMKPKTKRQLRWAGGLALYLGALWFLWPTPVLYPLRVFVVLLHELSHAAAAIATGGSVQRILLTADEGGATWTVGGNSFLTLSAGYLGSLLFGLGMLMAAGARPARVRLALGAIGVIVLGAALLLVRGAFGLIFTALAGAALLIAARRTSIPVQRTILTVTGLTSAIYALLDIRSDVLSRPDLPSDAAMLHEMTGIPTLVWGFAWFAIGVALAWLMVRRELARA